MKRFFRNVLDVQPFEDGILPLRLSPKQMDFFAPTVWKFRSYNTAGAVLDFVTDSPFFKMTYRVKLKPGTTEKVYFDLFVDGQPVGFQGKEITNKGTDEWTAQLPIEAGKPRRVTIYFPILARIIVNEMKVADGAIWEPAEAPAQNLLCLGDSITQGLSAAHPSATYAALISRFLGMNLLNQAMSGYYFNADSIDENLPYKPNLITVAYGTNDWAMCESYEQFNTQATAYIRKLDALYPHTPIVILSPIWRAHDPELKTIGEFTDIHRTLKQITTDIPRLHYIDGFSLVPHHPSYYVDGLHPNDEGFLHMALNLLRQLKEKGLMNS